jgi:hypothetical protein
MRKNAHPKPAAQGPEWATAVVARVASMMIPLIV